jgi:hypothetical protein
MKENRTIECLGGESMVSYLYGEMDVASQTNFDSHLSDCIDCTDAFAAIANSRFSVYEWQKIEFAPLETPQILIPYEPAKIPPAANWLDIFRTVFSPRGQWATAGVFAVMLLAAVFAYLIVERGPGTTDIAVADVPERETFRTDRPEPVSVQQSVPSIGHDVQATYGGDPAGLTAGEKGSSDIADKPNGVYRNTASDAIQSRNSRNGVVRSQPAPARSELINIRAQSAPRLHDFDDVADDGLRLADLFDDTEASD